MAKAQRRNPTIDICLACKLPECSQTNPECGLWGLEEKEARCSSYLMQESCGFPDRPMDFGLFENNKHKRLGRA